MDVIDTFLATFIAYIDSGFGLLAGDVAYLSTTLIAIDITLLAISHFSQTLSSTVLPHLGS